MLQIPDVTEEKIKDYLQLFDQDLGKKPQDMYHAKFLRSIRYCGQHTDTFIGRTNCFDVTLSVHLFMSNYTCIVYPQDRLGNTCTCILFHNLVPPPPQ